MVTCNFFIWTEEESLECLLEVVIEGDVDHGVDHCMRVGEHVDPEGVLGQLEKDKNLKVELN